MASEKKTPNRGGMCVFNLAGKLLLVTGLGQDDVWVLPKGHIEPGETPLETAEREVAEETGVKATAFSEPIATESYKYQNEDVVVEWYAGLATTLVPRDPTIDWMESDWRVTKWVTVEEALNLVKIQSLRNVIRKAVCMEEEV